jgi:hypothetical protein
LILPNKQITIISGHYGTGKTEFAVNLVIAMARDGREVSLVDLDIINPYFRSFERRRELEKEGIKVHVTSMDGQADIPSLPPSIMSIFLEEDQQSIIDLGGDPAGARVLGYYRPQLEKVDFNFWFVINKNRPETATLENVVHHFERTQMMSQQKITGIVNNTHLGRETKAEDIISGDVFAAEAAEKLGLPLICTTGERKFEEELEGKLTGSFFPLDIYMIKPWELSEKEGGQFEWLDM